MGGDEVRIRPAVVANGEWLKALHEVAYASLSGQLHDPRAEAWQRGFFAGRIAHPVDLFIVEDGAMVDLYEAGLVGKLVDTQTFDLRAIEDLRVNPDHHEVSAAEYADPLGLGAFVDELDMVILSALEVDLDFNVNVLTGSDGVMRGASGGHSDTARGAKLAIVVAPLLRSRTPTVVERVTTLVTPGSDIAALVTDVGIAVNPNRPELHERLRDLNLPLTSIADLMQRSIEIAGKPRPPRFGDKVVGVVRYPDGSVIDEVHEVIG